MSIILGNRKLVIPPSQQLIVPELTEDFVGWRPDMTDEAYHADRTAVTSTALRKVHTSAKAFYWKFIKGERDKESEALRIGRLVHMAMLEGSKFRERYVVEPVFQGFTAKGEPTTNANAKEVRAAREAWYASLPPGTVVVEGEDELEQIIEICNSVMEHPQGPALLKNGKPEVAGFFIDPATGIKMKIKPDLLRIDGTVLVDFKTSREVEMFRFGGSAHIYRYDFQLFMYAKGIEAITGKFPELICIIAVEKEPPYECCIYYLTREVHLHQAEIDYNAAVVKLQKALKENKWPGMQSRIQPLWIPGWFKHQANIKNEMMEEIYVPGN